MLIFAFSFGPSSGSEPGCSWAWASAAAQVAHVDVVTTSRYRDEIEQAAAADGAAPMFVHYVDPPRHARERWLHLVGYRVWIHRATKRALALHAARSYDVVHHLSYGNIWLEPVGRGLGLPLVVGPLNGGPRVPLALYPALGVRGSFREGSRRLVQQAIGLTFKRRCAWSEADVVLVANHETLERLPPDVRRRSLLRMQSVATPELMRVLNEHAIDESEAEASRTFVVAGRLKPWKGQVLALRTLLHLPGWHLTIVGRGPDARRIARVAHRIGVSDRVTMQPWLPYEDLWALMSRSRVVLVPSLRDDGPSIVTEAVMLGRPVVAFDQGVARLLSDSAGVVTVPIGSVSASVQHLAEAIRQAPPTADIDVDSVSWEALPELLSDVYARATRHPSPDLNRAREHDELSAVEFLREAALDAGKRVTKTAAAPILDVARASGAFGLAGGTTHADEALAHYERSGSIKGHRADLSEPARSLKTLGVGGPVPAPRPVTATMTLLDAAGDTLTFRRNHVIDDRGLAVVERVTDAHGNPLPLVDLRIGRVPLGKPRRIAGSIGYLSNSGVGNFGHWLVFALPLVQHYREYLGYDPDYYYVGTPVYKWHFDSLAALGIGRDRVVTEAVSGDRMLAAVVDDNLPPPSPHLDFSTNALRNPRGHSGHGARIYISRSLRPRRRLVNEAECLEVLRANGFEAVQTEKLTIDEETELFANAEVVVGAHGAGFANLLFCYPGCVMVEFFPHGFTTDWFDDTWPGVEISAARGIAYANLYGQRTRTWGLRPRDHPMLIDPEELDSVLAVATTTAERNRAIPGPADSKPDGTNEV